MYGWFTLILARDKHNLCFQAILYQLSIHAKLFQCPYKLLCNFLRIYKKHHIICVQQNHNNYIPHDNFFNVFFLYKIHYELSLFAYVSIFGYILKFIFQFFFTCFTTNILLLDSVTLTHKAYLWGNPTIFNYDAWHGIIGHSIYNRPFSPTSNIMFPNCMCPIEIHIWHTIMHVKQFTDGISKGCSCFHTLLFNPTDNNVHWYLLMFFQFLDIYTFELLLWIHHIHNKWVREYIPTINIT